MIKIILAIIIIIASGAIGFIAWALCTVSAQSYDEDIKNKEEIECLLEHKQKTKLKKKVKEKS